MGAPTFTPPVEQRLISFFELLIEIDRRIRKESKAKSKREDICNEN